MAFDPDDTDVVEPRPKAERSITTLLSDLASETILLIRQELALLKAELHEKFSRVGQGATALGAGALIAYSGWLVLLAAAVLGLATVLPAWLAALIVALVALAIGGALIYIGKSRFDADSLMPQRSLRSLREDEQWLRERLR
jgi:Putative Actinobacterial Holin-X, holin superfamily III